jgi:hypothetical protein
MKAYRAHEDRAHEQCHLDLELARKKQEEGRP